MSRKPPRFAALDCLLLVLFAAWMILPLFTLRYVNRWDSIESTFIADARFLNEHWPHPRWQPLWYTGTRFDYIYPPLLRYGTAGLARAFGLIPAQAYHLFSAIFYCLGIAALYWFVRVATRSRGTAWLAALGSLLLSPALAFIPRMRVPDWHRAPQRITVLSQYGEGPHMASLAILPLALACCFLAFERKRPAALAGAAFFSATVALTNFYGATALAMLFPVMLWSFWITHQDKAVFLRAAAIVGLAWGLTAFWLTPSYVGLTIRNMQYVSRPGNTWSIGLLAAVAAVYAWLTRRYARGRRERVWPVFVLGGAALFLLDVLGTEYFGFRVMGEPGRLIPELELVLILVALEGLRWLWRLKGFGQYAAAAIVVLSLASAWPYVRRHRVLFPRDTEFQRRPEYQLSEWIHGHLPGARTLAAGSVRFWYDTWHDLAQLGGGAEQGMLNPIAVPAQWVILHAEDAGVSTEWLQAMGVDAVIVDDKTSREMYHDFQFPQKFAGKFPVLFDNGAGDVIYAVPRRFPGIGRVVEAARLRSIRNFTGDPDAGTLHAYADMLEQGPDAPAPATWQSSDSFRVHARTGPGQLVLIQESWDPAWRAVEAGRELAVKRDPMGFLFVEPPAGEHDIVFRFALSPENAAGRLITAAAIIALLALVWKRDRRSPPAARSDSARSCT